MSTPDTTDLDVRTPDAAVPHADVLDAQALDAADPLAGFRERFVLEGGIRVQVRPSGTEPKVKLYGEAVDADPAPFLDALAALLQPG